MLYSLSGRLAYLEPGVAVIECSGVGYKCIITEHTRWALPPVGEETFLFTQLNVREDAVELFGFFHRSELTSFRMLTSVSGVGAKAGIAILSALTSEEVALAIASGDSKTLTRAPGVGNKLAQRIILELKDRMNKSSGGQQTENFVSYTTNDGKITEAMNALSVLGYEASLTVPLLSKLDRSLPVEELIRLTLRTLGRKT